MLELKQKIKVCARFENWKYIPASKEEAWSAR